MEQKSNSDQISFGAGPSPRQRYMFQMKAAEENEKIFEFLDEVLQINLQYREF